MLKPRISGLRMFHQESVPRQVRDNSGEPQDAELAAPPVVRQRRQVQAGQSLGDPQRRCLDGPQQFMEEYNRRLLSRGDPEPAEDNIWTADSPIANRSPKVGRSDPRPCGSGKE